MHFNVTAHPTARWTAQQLVEAFPFDSAPRYVLRDRDAIYVEKVHRRISGSLTLLSNITIAWMTLHMQQVIDRWKREEGRRVDPELLRHIGPARSEGVNFRGKLDFPVCQYQERLLAKSAPRN